MRLTPYDGKYGGERKKRFVPYWSSLLFPLRPILQDHLVEDLKKLESLSFLEVGLTEHFILLIKESH